MKKNLLLLTLMSFFFLPGFCQSLYSSTALNNQAFNPGVGVGPLHTPIIVFDDVLIPSTLVQGTDSVSITKLKFGIARFANAPAVTINFYYTILDDTATMIDNVIKLPPVLLGSVELPANGANDIATLFTLGDSVNSLFKVKTDTGNVFDGYQTIFIGVSFSNNDDPNQPNAWLLTDAGAPESDNMNVMWFYDADDPAPRYAQSFGPPPNPSATFYLEVFGKGLGTLPVTLGEFSARRSGSVNLLNWTTQQELNTRNFVVERGTDGRNFTTLGQVAAAGNSGSVHNYSFTDNHPGKGINYYRLRITDKDNGSKLSLTRSVRNAGLADVKIFPNPVTDKLIISVDADKATQGYLTISDVGGKVVYSTLVKLQAGNTILPVTLSAISAGSYIMKIQLDDDVIVKKFNKQ